MHACKKLVNVQVFSLHINNVKWLALYIELMHCCVYYPARCVYYPGIGQRMILNCLSLPWITWGVTSQALPSLSHLLSYRLKSFSLLLANGVRVIPRSSTQNSGLTVTVSLGKAFTLMNCLQSTLVKSLLKRWLSWPHQRHITQKHSTCCSLQTRLCPFGSFVLLSD